MKAICIDGDSRGQAGINLPEGVDLDVYEFSEDPDYYWVLGYEGDPKTLKLLVWHKRRFILLSDSEEIEAEHQHEAIIYQR